MSRIFSNHNGMKLETTQTKTGKFTNIYSLNNMLLNNQWVKEEKKNTLTQMKNEMKHIKMYGMQQKYLLREEF